VPFPPPRDTLLPPIPFTPPWLGRGTVRLFAILAEKAGVDRVSVPIPPGATARSVLERLAWQHPALAAFLPSCRVAKDDRFLAADDPVRPGEEVSVIPPVSGG